MMAKDSMITAWRKQHRLARDAAAAVLGLSIHGYNKQVTGANPVSEPSRRIMEMWGLLTDEQRETLLGKWLVATKK